MQANYNILSAATVPASYIWDDGIPLIEANFTAISAYSTNTYVSGYAPGVRVVFTNVSEPDSNYDNAIYNWNFGDYYNDTNNTASLSCTSSVEHTYIMPGTYNVSLTLIQSKTVPVADVGEDLLCKGKYSVRWFWDDLNSDNLNSITWNETRKNSVYEKQWYDETKCFEKHCTNWSWSDLQRINAVNWSDTQTGSDFEKKWMFEANDTICTVKDATFLNTLQRVEQTVIKSQIVVVEKPPIANMYCVTRPLTGYTPFTVQLTPRTTTTGSFPIDRIDWDFGDGSPIKTVTRYVTPTGDNIINTSTFTDDAADVRNFDIIHTYVRNRNTYSVFYPSLTCYSASTSTSDSCSITIGPVSLSASTPDLHLIKARNTLKGNIYALNVGKNIAFTTTTGISTQNVDTLINVPTTTLRDSYGLRELSISTLYFGNTGAGYPPEVTLICE